MTEIYKTFEKQLEEIGYLGNVMGILHWDQEVIMPEGGADSRAKQLSALAGLYHEKSTHPKLGAWLDTLEKLDARQLDDHQWCNVRETRREYDRTTKVPRELVEELADLGSRGHQVWARARQDNKFSDFAPLLTRMIELKKQWAHHVDPNQAPYDVNIDQYERGFTMAELDPIFARLKEELVPLIRSIQDSGHKPDTGFLEGTFPINKQEALGRRISTDMGFCFEQGRMDVSVHPFCGGGDPTDVRITTRYREDNFIESLYAVIHETGHGLYEQGRMKEGRALPVSESLTMGVHESQSLFWERMIAQQKPFLNHYLDLFRETFPDNFKGIEVQKLYEAINVSQPSFIRVEADEVTYPMHVLIRYEIEKGLFDGTIAVEKLPQIWNDKMKEYLGIRPPTDTLGVLQDVHWSGGAFGYFPSYTLGAMLACQFYNALLKQVPETETAIAEGRFQVVKKWLNENIHSQGRLLDTSTLIQKVTGESFNIEHFLQYLRTKYQALYRLESRS